MPSQTDIPPGTNAGGHIPHTVQLTPSLVHQRRSLRLGPLVPSSKKASPVWHPTAIQQNRAVRNQSSPRPGEELVLRSAVLETCLALAWPAHDQFPHPPSSPTRQLAHLHTTKSRQTAITPDPHEKNGVVVSGMAWQNTAAHITFSLACASACTVYDELLALLVSHPHRRHPAPHPCHGPWAMVPRCYRPRPKTPRRAGSACLACLALAGLGGTLNVPCSPAPPSHPEQPTHVHSRPRWQVLRWCPRWAAQVHPPPLTGRQPESASDPRLVYRSDCLPFLSASQTLSLFASQGRPSLNISIPCKVL